MKIGGTNECLATLQEFLGESSLAPVPISVFRSTLVDGRAYLLIDQDSPNRVDQILRALGLSEVSEHFHSYPVKEDLLRTRDQDERQRIRTALMSSCREYSGLIWVHRKGSVLSHIVDHQMRDGFGGKGRLYHGPRLFDALLKFRQALCSGAFPEYASTSA